MNKFRKHGDSDAVYRIHALQALIEVFADQMLYDNSYISDSNAVKAAAVSFFHVLDELRDRKNLDRLDCPHELCPCSCFNHISWISSLLLQRLLILPV